MNININRIAGAIATVTALALQPAAAQQNIGATPPGAMPDHPPYERADRSAVDGDRHDADPFARGNQGPHMSMPLSKIMKSLLAATKQNDWTTAKAKLAEAQALSEPSDFDKFEIDVMTGYVAFRTSDQTTALAAYKRVIASPYFAKAQTKVEQAGTLRNAMVLSNATGAFADSISYGQQLASLGSMDESAAISLATAYFGNEDYSSAQSLAQKAIDAETAAGKAPDPTAQEIVTKSKAAMQ